MNRQPGGEDCEEGCERDRQELGLEHQKWRVEREAQGSGEAGAGRTQTPSAKVYQPERQKPRERLQDDDERRRIAGPEREEE